MSSPAIQDSFLDQNQTNLTTVYSNTQSGTHDILALIETYSVPVICIGGLIGNTISAFVFLQKPLRENSSSLFLTARSISDNGFLATLLTIWASSVYDLHIGNFPPMCQMLIFFTYVFGCYSVWLVVFVTAENYIRICRPFLVQRVCNTKIAKISMVILLALVLITYNFPFWTMGERCIPLRKYYSFIQILVYLDTVLTLVIPAIIMICLTSAIAATAIASCKRQRRRSASSITSVKSPLVKVTTMLLAVTLCFSLLNLPHHVVRLRLMVLAFVEKKVDISLSNEIAIQSISQLLYYLSVSTNVLIYLIFSSRFRKTLSSCFMRQNTRMYAQPKAAVYPMRKSNNALNEIPVKNISDEMSPLRCYQNSDL